MRAGRQGHAAHEPLISSVIVAEVPLAGLSFDLLVAAVELLGGEFQDVVISELKEHTYFATIRVLKDGEIVEIDARPSDAIAVAVTCEPNLPIYVAEEVLSDVLG